MADITQTYYSATEESAREWVASYERAYPYMGYMTRLVSLREINGHWRAVVTRLASCD